MVNCGYNLIKWFDGILHTSSNAKIKVVITTFNLSQRYFFIGMFNWRCEKNTPIFHFIIIMSYTVSSNRFLSVSRMRLMKKYICRRDEINRETATTV